MEKLYGEAIQAYFDQHNIELKKLIFSGNETDKHISVVENLGCIKKESCVQKSAGVGCGRRRHSRRYRLCNGAVSPKHALRDGLYNCRNWYRCWAFSALGMWWVWVQESVRCIPPTCDYLHRQIFFKTLHRGWVRHGIAEIIKMAVIRDESLFRLVEQNSSDLLWTKFGTEMAEFDGDHEAFGKLCDLVIGKSLEGLVLFFWKIIALFFSVPLRFKSVYREQHARLMSGNLDSESRKVLLVESGIPLMLWFWNPSSTDKESGIQGVESRWWGETAQRSTEDWGLGQILKWEIKKCNVAFFQVCESFPSYVVLV